MFVKRKTDRTEFVEGCYKTPKIFPLTPTQDASDIAAYKARLDAAFSISDVRNIAVTGKFGAGKSSVLKTYFHGKKVLWVTLAPFIEYANSLPKGDNKSKRDRLARLLEISVLKQMFYTSKRSELPFSRFSRIVRNGLGLYLLVAFTVISFLAVLFFGWQPAAVWDHIKSVTANDREIFCVTALYCSVIPLTIIIMATCDFLRCRRFYGKLNAACAEVEVGSPGKDMSFNRTVDEIIYHFQRIKYEAVVFEDVDRFTEPIIFAKLKEMNHIINESRDIKKENKPIRFVYALRDMALSDEQRVKFFDYILPIVPITSITNSEEHFVGLLSEILGRHGIDDRTAELIHTMAQYVVDARLIRNICNEFSAYRDQLDSELPCANLLGMTVLKNVLPHEYEKLLRGEGVVVDLLKLAESKVELEQKGINEEIEAADNKLESLDPDADSEQITALRKENAKRRSKKVEWGRENFGSLLRHKYINRDDLLSEIGVRMDLQRRCYVPIEGRRPSLDSRQINVLLGLLSGGFVDENYKHYLSKFEDSIISAQDHKFVLSVIRNSPLAWQYPLDSVENVRGELGTWFYERVAILNYALVRSALLGMDWPGDKRDVLLGFVLNGDEKNMEFIDGLLLNDGDKQESYQTLLPLIRRFQSDYSSILVLNDKIERGRKLVQLGHFLGTEKDLSKITISQSVLKFFKSFSHLGDMFGRMGLDEIAVKQFLSGGRLRFSAVDFNEDPSAFDPVFKIMLETDAYELEPELLKGMMQKLGQHVDNWDNASGSIVFGCSNEQVRRRIDLDLGAFLKKVYFKSENMQDDDQSFIEFVLNHGSLGVDVKKRFLDRQSQGIANARRIRVPELVAYAMEANRLIPSWENVVGYYEKFIETADVGDDGVQVEDADVPRRALRDYVLKHRSWFECAKFNVDYQYDYIVMALFVGSPEIHDTFAKNLLRNCSGLKARIYLENTIPPQRILWLAERKMTEFELSTYKRLKEQNTGSHIAYACVHLGEFIADMKNGDLAAADLQSILNSDNIDVHGAIALSKAFKEMILNDDNVQRSVARFITVGTLSQFDNKIVCHCFGWLSPVSVQCHVISCYNFDRENSIRAVKLMPQPFRSLIKWGEIIDVPRSAVVRNMLGKLKGVGIINSFGTAGTSYRVHIAKSGDLQLT